MSAASCGEGRGCERVSSHIAESSDAESEWSMSETELSPSSLVEMSETTVGVEKIDAGACRASPVTEALDDGTGAASGMMIAEDDSELSFDGGPCSFSGTTILRISYVSGL